ncbi:Ofd1 protein, putative [Anopheles sinensis]|uniref:Ofd1 protein, putative n=1 Tax=Anopheles sinensis TaxID=74873 RepID=A0A084W3Q4_ANOSI|nr:Ofd1 protein, putative [Anopheles sinensis]
MGGIQSASVGRENSSAGETHSGTVGEQPETVLPEVEVKVPTTLPTVEDGGGQETNADVEDQRSDEVGVENAARVGLKDGVDDGVAAHDATDSDDDGMAKCRARKMTAELATFRQELQLKREVHQAKLSNVRHELEYLRAALAEEKGRNRALIKYVQQQEQQLGKCSSLNQLSVHGAGEMSSSEDRPEVAEAATAALMTELGGDDGANGMLEAAGESNDRRSSAREQSEDRVVDRDRDDEHTHTIPGDGADHAHDERLALKKELAESQLELQRATGDALELRRELGQLRTQLHALQDESLEESTRQSGSIRALKAELAESQFQLQIAQAEVLSLQTDVGQLRNQVRTLKDVIKAGKEIIAIREDQVEQLKGKLRQIEDTLQEREVQIMSDDLRREYDRQLTNIRNLRDLYEERERVSRMERDNLLRQLDLKKGELATEQEKNKNLESLVESLQTDLSRLRAEQEQTQEKLAHSQAETRQLQLEMGVVNQFISKFLLGMSRKPAAGDINIDKLAAVLEENRALLIDMTKEEAETLDTGAFLPRALYDLIAEVDEANEPEPLESQETVGKENGEEAEEAASGEEDEFTEVQKASPEEIADKLPKVWRVLIELVNHQERAQPVPFVEGGESEECLKSVQTSKGPKTVVSVSKTYIKLKDLILEKKSLKKETNRLRTLNSHLERRLDTQEKRLSAVSLELTKTWHLVGKMQRQHRQLHTQEQILRYHLQQKRRLLSELKEELEYCRLKWSAARQKNIESEDQWKSLKADFAARRKQDSLNNSGESGYSDEQPSDEDDTDSNTVGRRQKSQFSVAQEDGSKRRDGFGGEVIVHRVGQRFLSSSLTNICQLVMAATAMRKAHSESDMKSLENVERANRFCNEKIEDLPLFPDEEDVVADAEGLPGVALRKKHGKAGTPGKKGKKRRKNAPETAQEMFLRLMNLTEDEEADDGEDDEDEGEDDGGEDHERTGTGNDDAEGEYSENESASELSEEELGCLAMDGRDPASTSAAESEQALTSEEQFQRKREARLLRMAELNSRLDRYSSPTPTTSTEVDSENNDKDTTPSGVLSEDEERYLQRRAERLERLEREAREFRNRLSKTVNRGTEIAAQIDGIHSGFIARQADSASPVAGSSGGRTGRTVEEVTPVPSVDLSCLTDKEREYTSARAERLERLEGESQRLLRQMNQTVRRGSSLTTKLDMLHSRYAGPAASEAAPSNATTQSEETDVVNLSKESNQEVEESRQISEEPLQRHSEEQENQNDDSLPLTGPYLPLGPVELVLVSDDDVMEEVNEQLLGGHNSQEPNRQSPDESPPQ